MKKGEEEEEEVEVESLTPRKQSASFRAKEDLRCAYLRI